MMWCLINEAHGQLLPLLLITTSGPRRIFTPRPVTQRTNRPHTVRLGRIGQIAWLMVDNLQNVSSSSPGRLSQLNTRSMLYLGK
jgi:EYS protein